MSPFDSHSDLCAQAVHEFSDFFDQSLTLLAPKDQPTAAEQFSSLEEMLRASWNLAALQGQFVTDRNNYIRRMLGLLELFEFNHADGTDRWLSLGSGPGIIETF